MWFWPVNEMIQLVWYFFFLNLRTPNMSSRTPLQHVTCRTPIASPIVGGPPVTKMKVILRYHKRIQNTAFSLNNVMQSEKNPHQILLFCECACVCWEWETALTPRGLRFCLIYATAYRVVNVGSIKQQDRRYTCNVILRRVRVTIVAVEKQ